MGGGQNVNQQAQIPDELKPLITGSVGNVLGLQGALPIGSFTTPQPGGVAGLSPMQTWGMNQIPSLFQPSAGQGAAWGAISEMPELASRPLSTPSAETNQLGVLGSVIGGPVGSSPATRSGMEAWRQSVLPTVEHEMVNAGLGRSGDLLKAVGSSASQAMFPLLQQEIANRMTGAGMLGQVAQAQTQREMVPREQTLQSLQFGANTGLQLASQEFQQRQAAIQQALSAGQITRDIAQQQLDNAHSEFLRLAALSEAATLGPLGQVLPSLIGTRARTSRNVGVLDVLGK